MWASGSFTTFHNLHLNFQTSCAQRATKTRKKLKRSKWATSTLCKMCCGDPAPLKQSKPLSILWVALGCRASAIIYRKTRVYGDYQWIIAINASARPLTLQPNATPTADTVYPVSTVYPVDIFYIVYTDYTVSMAYTHDMVYTLTCGMRGPPKAQKPKNFPDSNFRGGICPCRHCRRQCKIFASGVNFSIFTHCLCFSH